MKLNATDDTSRHTLVVLESGEDVDNIGVAAVALWRKNNREAILAVDGVSLMTRILATCRAVAVGGCGPHSDRCRCR